MSTKGVRERHVGRRWMAALMAVVVISSFTSAVYAVPSSFVELDGNIADNSVASPPYDWGSLFTGGVFNGQNTPPTAPTLAVSDPTIAAAAFKVDPLAADVTECGTGDPTVFTGQGSEKNGGDLNVFTINTASIPGKDDLSNVYAVAHIATGVNEVFFGAERIINNGDSHIDFEFLQSPLTIPDGCGVRTLSGHRSMGDLLLVVDFTRGGTLGGTQIHEWRCLADNQTQPADGTVCDPTGTKPTAHYAQVSQSAVSFLVNGDGDSNTNNDIACGDWGCRSDTGAQQAVVNENEFMEGGIDLAALGFTGCFSTLLPHTRSSQSFTATLKDLEAIPFNTCKTPAIATQVKKVSDNTDVTPATPIPTGVAVYDTATLTNATADAGGTVTYRLYTNNTCTTLSTSPQLGAVAASGVTVTVTGGIVPASNTVANGSVSFTTGGTWYFQATYTGDARNTVPAGGLKSACTSETVVVKNNPTINTVIKTGTAPNDTPISNPVTIPTTVHDTATLTGATSDAGGTVTYRLYTNNTCTTLSTSPQLGAVAADGATVTVTNGTVPNSPNVTFSSAGNWWFQATYSGDANNTGPVSSACTSEPIVVAPNTPVPHSTPVVQIKDTLTVTGFTANATGSVLVGLYTSADCTTGQVGSNASFPVSGAVSGTLTAETTFQAVLAGTYRYKISYAGDTSNTSFSSCAEIVGVSITSLP